MELKRSHLSPKTRLDTGAVILAAAAEISVQPVKPRLSAFAAAQRRYADAQRKVDAADTRLRAGLGRVATCDAAQDAAVDALARALVADGQSWKSPFAALGAAAPGSIKELPVAEEAKMVHQLVAAVQRQTTASKATRQAGQAADKAARAVERALAPLDRLERMARATRQKRDAIGQTWDTALAALKRGTRAAADDGAPGLYAALFGRMARPTTKKKPQPTPAPPAVNTSVSQPVSNPTA